MGSKSMEFGPRGPAAVMGVNFFSLKLVLEVIAPLLLVSRRGLVQAQQSVQANVMLRNRMDPGDVVQMDCMLADAWIDPKGFLPAPGASGSTAKISQTLSPDDTIFCDFMLGFVPQDMVEVVVKCAPGAGCSPLSVDFTSAGVYLNLTTGSSPLGPPDIAWSSLIPSQRHR